MRSGHLANGILLWPNGHRACLVTSESEVQNPCGPSATCLIYKTSCLVKQQQHLNLIMAALIWFSRAYFKHRSYSILKGPKRLFAQQASTQVHTTWFKKKAKIDCVCFLIVAIMELIQRSPSYLEQSGSTVRIMFYDFSSTLDTIQPELPWRNWTSLKWATRWSNGSYRLYY